MSLDFNSLEPQNSKKSLELQETQAKSLKPTHTALMVFITLVSLGLSVLGLTLSTYTIRNLPKPETISILCEPGLQEKLENEVRILEEIAKSAKK